MKYSITSSIFHKYNKKKKTWIFKLFQFVIFFLIFIFFAGVLYQFIASEMDKSQFKMKGKLFSVGSYRLMANTSGSGKYTVVFESDIGSPIQQWNSVRESLGKDYKLFSYERSGYGWSDSSGEAANIERSVSDLKKVLSRSGCNSPYILVGHGYGGLIMTQFAEKYPEEVAGVVLIDSLMEQDIESREFQANLKSDIRKYSADRFFANMGGVRLAYSLNILKSEEPYLKNLTDEEKALFQSQRVTPKYYAAMSSELKVLRDYKGEIQKAGALKDTFLEVLTPSSKFGDDERDKAYDEVQKKLAAMSSGGDQMLVERTGSYIQIDRPDAVVNAVERIVKKAGKI
ncbi:MAG: alpha/beta hydrolase [Bacillota bacterium]|nr:alpha/beta hydrolase [Bacillota bacterium]